MRAPGPLLPWSEASADKLLGWDVRAAVLGCTLSLFRTVLFNLYRLKLYSCDT